MKNPEMTLPRHRRGLEKHSDSTRTSLRLMWAAIGVCAAISASTTHAQEPGTRIIDHFSVGRATLAKTGQRISSADFESKPELGPVWVMFDYTARVTGLGGNGKTSFEVMPEGVKLRPSDSYMLFQARQMANYEVDTTHTLTYAGVSRVMTPAEVKKIALPENYASYMELLNEEKKRTKDWVQLIQTNQYVIPADEPGKIHIEMNILDNMEPMNLEVLIGQGPVPAAVRAYMEKRNRSWFHRYQQVIYMLGAILAAGFFALRYLRKS